jgi:hypothetical protein
VSRRNLAAQGNWLEVRATILSATYHPSRIVDIDVEIPFDNSFFLMTFNYQAKGRSYEGEFERFEPLEVGSVLTIFYNPERPNENSLALYPERKSSRLVKLLIVCAVVFLAVFLERHFGWDLGE